MKIKTSLCCTVDNEEKHMKYFYRLTEGEYHKYQAYGIEIERQDYVNEELVNIERDSIKFISYSEEKVSGIIQKLYKGEVSPIHLWDIFSEYEDECIKEFKM